jgi:hypothetical protein
MSSSDHRPQHPLRAALTLELPPLLRLAGPVIAEIGVFSVVTVIAAR